MFTDAAIKEIARVALEQGTGARDLRSVVEEVLEEMMFEVRGDQGRVLARRKPPSVSRFDGAPQNRFAERNVAGRLSTVPPR